MERIREVDCSEFDALHGRKKEHECSCKLRQGHGKVHTCPVCERKWGQPEYKLKATPHAGPKVRRFNVGMAKDGMVRAL